MKILPDSQINNMPILEDVLEELRLNIIDHLQYIADAKYLYSLNSDELKQKLGLLGLTSINIGKFISLDLSQDIFRYISPEFYKMYRKLNQHRGNKMSMDYIFHSAGMMNTLVHSNDQYYNATNIFDDVGSFFDFNTFRDNQFPELEIGDGYIIVPYTSNKVQLLKQYLATNPIIFSFLPAGYTFIFLSDYRNSFDNGALQYDNVLNYLDTQEVVEYLKQLYWEPYNHYTAEEQIIYPNSEEEVTYTHDLYYYDPIYFRDLGYPFFINNYSRFEDDSLYILPYGDDLYTFNTLEEYLIYYTMLLMDSVLTDYENGLEADLNNPLFYKDVWVGDHLVSYLLGENVESEYPDHVKGLKAIQNPSYSYASLYDRGQSLASQYLQRENGIISKTDVLIQEHKPEIISDRREMDLFKIVFNDEYSLWLIAAYDLSQASLLLQNVMGIDANLADLIVSNMPSLIQNSLDYDMAEYYFNQLISSLTSNDTIFEVRDNGDNVVLTNASSHNTHTEEITSNNYIPSYMASMNKVDLGSSTPITTYTLSYVNTQLPDITITMPSSSVGASGTVVTLPTMSGEYESGGKTWTPSTWDIGAFGSSYTITADTIAHLVFEETQTMPTVSLNGDFGANNWVDLGSIYPGQTREVKLNSSAIPYDSTKSYAVAGVTYTGSSEPVAELIDLSVAETSDHTFGLKNSRIEEVRITTARIAVCSDPSATVVHVYDKSTGAAYNAFKYTNDGVDYYYILDGVQSAWSNDIDTLGFALGDGFTEIKLYGNVSSTIYCQNNVTSGFTGNVNTANVLQLYTDNAYATPWNGYDYSNDYKMGVYSSSGVWYSRGGTIADLPATTANPGNGETVSKLFVLLDTGCLWFVCNNSNSSWGYNNNHAYFYGTVTLRIYPKGQQVFSGYFNSSDVYNNSSLAYHGNYSLYGSPNTGSTKIPLISDFDRSLVKFLGSGGNVVSNRYNNFAWLSGQYLRVTYGNTNDGTLAIRNALYYFNIPIYFAWVRKTGDSSVSSGTAVYTYNNISNGYLLGYETGAVYKVIALFKADGSSATDSSTVINACSLGKYGSGDYANNLFFKQTSGSSISFSYLLYTKEYPTSIEIFFTLAGDGSGVTFSANDYWGSWIMSDADKTTLQNFGVVICEPSTNKYAVAKENLTNFTFTPLALYNGSTDLGADMSNFYCAEKTGTSGTYQMQVCIWSVNAYATSATKWKCRISKI